MGTSGWLYVFSLTNVVAAGFNVMSFAANTENYGNAGVATMSGLIAIILAMQAMRRDGQ